MKNIRLFDTQADYNAATLDYPNVAYVKETDEVIMQKTNPLAEYLNFTAVNGDATIGMSGNATPNVSYSFDKNTWTTWDYSDLTIPNGTTVYMKGNNPNGIASQNSYYSYYKTFTMNGVIKASGNIMSLIYDDNFEGQLTIPSNYCFYNLFRDCTSLTSAPALPATTLAQGCYYYMFYGCTSLTSAPQLPATSLAYACYYGMFQKCTSLTSAPQLPATTLTNSCYYNMFQGCTNLTTAPQLPATTLAQRCYAYMFRGCTSLTSAPTILPATEMNYSNAYQCYVHMFEGCTSLTIAPELPSTTLASGCYNGMFSGCTSLNYIKAMFTTTPSNDYTSDWVSGVASSGTFVKNREATWTTTGNNGVPNNWTIEYADA